MNIISCGESINIKSCYAHNHSSWEIIVQKSGIVTSNIDNAVYEVKPGDVLVIPPGVVHDGESEENYSDMFFQVDNLDFFGIIVVHDFDGSILNLVNMLHKIMTEKERDYDLIANSLVEAICRYIKKYSQIDNKYPFVNKIKNTIYENISNPLFDLHAAIEKSGFDKDYFRRCFKKEIGKNPLEYITELRINKSKMMLKKDTFISVENVAHNCGFNDSFYFSRCFKKHVGISPLKYRKKYIADREI